MMTPIVSYATNHIVNQGILLKAHPPMIFIYVKAVPLKW